MATLPPDKRPRLRDIVRGNVDDFKRRFDDATPTSGFDPLPPGVYRCLAAEGKVFAARTGTEGFKLTFEVIGGPFAGRKVWHDIWMSDKAMGMARAELLKLGIRCSDDLERPLPPGLIADVTVVQRTDDDGAAFNRVKAFKVVNADVPADNYSPDPDPATREADAGPLDAAGPASTPHPAREPGEDDDRDDGGFDWRSGIQHTSSAPLLDAAGNQNGRPPA
jgi:hypothetical protein